MAALAIADWERKCSVQKTEATGTLSPPPNNGDKKKGNCLGINPSHPATAQDVGRTDRHEQPNDREEGAHLRNRSEAADESGFFEAAFAHVAIAPALIHIDVVIHLSAREEGSRDVNVNVAFATAAVFVIIDDLVSAQVVAEGAEGAVEEPVAVGGGVGLQSGRGIDFQSIKRDFRLGAIWLVDI